jgi:hypothetical protein
LLPIVMRAVGGTSGWTTLIYVQPGTATQATVRYYALGTGALVTSQTLALAATGTRLDPRALPALQDNAQYAVTIDGNGGTLTAIAHEQAGVGGDASMIYEGFALPSLPAGLQPGSVMVQPGNATVASNATQQFSAAVKDQFGGPFSGAALAWTVVSSTLGVISQTGLFTAAAASGAGVVTVTTSGMAASAPVSVQGGATTAIIGGITFRVTSSAHADFFVEAAISDVDTQTLASLIEPAVSYLQVDFARSYVSRPQIYAFASGASIVAGWNSVLGATTPAITNFSGVFIEETGRIGLNWPVMKTALPFATVRHELTHQMEHQLTHGLLFPAWFDEGMARFEDLSVPGGQYRILDSRATVVSMVATGTLLNVMNLSTSQFYALSAVRLYAAYEEGAETVRLMRADLTQAGIARMLEAVGVGQSFDAAYALVSGQPLSTFVSTRNARLAALAPSPGIATAPDTFLGPGLSIEAYGLVPLASLTLTIRDQSGGVSLSSRAADEFGGYRTYLDSTWPITTYAITVTSGSTTLTIAAAKTTSLSSEALQFLEPGDRYLLPLPGTGLAQSPAE